MMSRAAPVYLDHNATTPIDPAVRAAMAPYLDRYFGNPSSAHRLGREARRGIDEAREAVARLIGAAPAEIVFTSGGSESLALAILGSARARGRPGHVVTSPTEHPAVLTACRELERQGHRVTALPVDGDGRVETAALERALAADTFLVAIMLANNETGVLQPVRELARIARAHGALFLTDAVQAVGKIPVGVADLGVDMLSIAGHKLYAPKGVGALYMRNGVSLERILSGGHQERDLRPGTENVAGIVGLGCACRIASDEVKETAQLVRGLREELWSRLHASCPECVRNSLEDACLPNTLHVSFPGLDGESLVIGLDLEGVQVSSGAACASGAREPSHVLAAMGMERERALGSLRLSLGRRTTAAQIARAVRTVAAVARSVRAARQEPAR
jgi:cysteine desulfurase